MSCQWNIFRLPLKNFSSFKFIILNMITISCCFAHSFKIMCIPHPGWADVNLPRTTQAIRSGRGDKIDIAYIRCIDGREPEDFELWDFAEDGIR